MKKICAAWLLLLAVEVQASEYLSLLKKEIGQASCLQDTECRVVALGAKSCGGAEFYWPWSVAEGQASRIDALAKSYREARVKQNSGELSDCRLLKPPAVACVKQHCVLQGEDK